MGIKYKGLMLKYMTFSWPEYTISSLGKSVLDCQSKLRKFFLHSKLVPRGEAHISMHLWSHQPTTSTSYLCSWQACGWGDLLLVHHAGV
jgi:hypothetical protein